MPVLQHLTPYYWKVFLLERGSLVLVGELVIQQSNDINKCAK